MTSKADLFRSLHVPGDPVILPNAWDVTSGRVFATAGFGALATSSVAMANSLGYSDGEETPPDEMFAAVRRVTGAVDVPVTADIERGYRLPPNEIAERLVAVGAVGCNLEDSDPATGELIDADTQAAFLRDVVTAAGSRVLVNARVDVHIREAGEAATRLEEAIRRGRAYLAAGAGCVYPIGIIDGDEIKRFVNGVDGPVNVTFRPGTPTLRQLRDLGVARVSYGGGLHLAMKAWLRGVATRISEGESPYEGL
jgi:2-methylisocitrate lyase-like PEP mutase family enzyme